MKRRLLKYGSIIAAITFLAVFYGLAIYNTPASDAVKATDFNPGRIIDDAVFYNSNTMSVEEIQSFLDAKLPTCDMWGQGSSAGRVVNETGYVMPAGSTNADYARARMAAGNTNYHEPPYVCINKYYENPETHETLYETNGVVKEGMISAAQIIYNEAKAYSINPQVLLVLLKKESYVWGDNWPLKWEYNTAMGYGCPDTAPCDTSYYGFYNQIHMAAYQFNRYKERNWEYNYHPGMTNTIQYSPNYSCGTKQVFIENMATASLYIYTPYVPNDAALRNYPGESYCGSYGNRNFFMYFSEWFGSTYGTAQSSASTIDAKAAAITEGFYRITPVSDTSKSAQIDQTGLYAKNRLENEGEFYKIAANEDGSYTLYSHAEELVFDVPRSEAEEGAVITGYAYHGGDNQRWKIYDNLDGSYTFATILDEGLVLNVENETIKLAKYDKSASSQKFYLVSNEFFEVDGTKNYRIESKAKAGRFIDIIGGITKESSDKIIGSFSKNNGTSDNQTFHIIRSTDDGFFRIQNTYSGLFLGINGDAFKNGNKITVSAQTDSCTQKWRISEKEGGYLVFLSACGDVSLDLNVNNGNINNYTLHGGNNQQWRLIEADHQLVSDGTYIISSALDQSYGLKSNGYLKDISLSTEPSLFTIKFDEYLGYYRIYGEANESLDVPGSSYKNGTETISFTYHGGCNQRWKIETDKHGNYSIKTFCADYTFDVWGSSLTTGKVTIWQPHGGLNQSWILTKNPL